jgi:magnesium-transporting ATPase (P-type)
MWVNVPVILLGSLTATLHSAYSQNSYDQWAILRELAINFLFLNGLNNLSTRFIGDLVRIAQCLRMGADSHLLIETNRTIPDTLGNVQVIISDKTGAFIIMYTVMLDVSLADKVWLGTITKNQLKLEQIAVADDGGAINLYNVRGEEIQLLVQPYKGSAQDEPRERVAVNRFLSFMAVANAVVPKNESYFSSNPDDLEFVHEARKLNHELVKRSAREDGHMIVVERLLRTGEKAEVREDVEMKVLYEHDFDSSRKYMSVIQEYQAYATIDFRSVRCVVIALKLLFVLNFAQT